MTDNRDDENMPNVSFDFSKFMKETLKKEESKPKLDPTSKDKEPFNPNKEYFKKYHEGIAGRMWILDPKGSKQPRYR